MEIQEKSLQDLKNEFLKDQQRQDQESEKTKKDLTKLIRDQQDSIVVLSSETTEQIKTVTSMLDDLSNQISDLA